MNVSLGPILDEYAVGKKLNIGSGCALGVGWANLDMIPESGAEVIHDLNTLPLPFAHEEFDTVLASHVLEHVERGRTLPLVYDVARVLKPGGCFIVAVPYATHMVAYANPLHTQLFDEHSWQYFSKECYAEPNSDGYKANQGQPVAEWKVEKLALVVCDEFAKSSEHDLEFAKRHYLNVIREMIVVMRKVGM